MAEFCEPSKRHIVSVFKIIQELLAPSQEKGKNQFQQLMEMLPNDHKAELEQLLCFDTEIDAEKFCNEKCAIYERIKDLNLSHRAVVVYYYLCERANKEGKCWPAIPTIAEEIKLSQQTVRRAIRDLEKSGCIQTEQRFRTKGGKSSLLFQLL